MNDNRPEKPPFTATLVLRGSTLLTLAEKIVWLEDYVFDRGPEGAYVSAASVSARWGQTITPKTVENARNTLKRLRLHEARRRDGAKNVWGWFAVLPLACLPQMARPTSADIARLSRRLDDHITQVRAGPESTGADDHPPTGGDTTPPRVVGPPGTGWTDHLPAGGHGVAALGGRGEGSTSSSRRKTTLQPHAVEEDGVGSREPELQDGGRNLSPSERRALALQEADDAARIRRAAQASLDYALAERERRMGMA